MTRAHLFAHIYIFFKIFLIDILVFKNIFKKRFVFPTIFMKLIYSFFFINEYNNFLCTQNTPLVCVDRFVSLSVIIYLYSLGIHHTVSYVI